MMTAGMMRDAKLLFAAVAVMLMVSSAFLVMPAYAYSTSVSGEAGIGSVYKCVDVCSYSGSGTPVSVAYDEDDFTTDDSLNFDTSDIKITKKNGKYSVSGTASITGHYAVVAGNMEGLKLYASLTENGDGNLEGISYTVTINGTVLDDDTDCIDVVCGTAYLIEITADMSGVGSNLTEQPVLPTLKLVLSLSSDGGASTVTADSISIVYTSVVAASEIVEINQEEKEITLQDGDENYSYTEDDGEVYYIVPNEDREDGHAAVYITNGDDSTAFTSTEENYTSDSRTTTLELPSNREFVIQADISGAFIISGGTISVELTIDGTTYTGEVKKNGTVYFYVKNVNNKNLATTSDIDSVTWMSGESVSVTITGSSNTFWSSVTISLQIVFN